jgi:hypothetical protein
VRAGARRGAQGRRGEGAAAREPAMGREVRAREACSRRGRGWLKDVTAGAVQ